MQSPKQQEIDSNCQQIIAQLKDIYKSCSEIGEVELSEITSGLILLINTNKVDDACDVITQCFKIYSQSDVSQTVESVLQIIDQFPGVSDKNTVVIRGCVMGNVLKNFTDLVAKLVTSQPQLLNAYYPDCAFVQLKEAIQSIAEEIDALPKNRSLPFHPTKQYYLETLQVQEDNPSEEKLYESALKSVTSVSQNKATSPAVQF